MQHLITVLDWIRYSATRLAQSDVYYGHGTTTPLDEAAALVLGLLSLPYDLASAYFAARLTEQEQQLLAEGLRRRIEQRLPVPYITKRTLYGGLLFYIDERALIPRSPIAELIEKNVLQPDVPAPQRILDLCCGCGCLGLLAKYYFPEAEVVLADIDRDALDVARINMDTFGLDEDDVMLIESDLWDNIDGKFDWIICNPPYVEAAEMDEIAAEYLHEPEHALVSGKDGLDAARIILRGATDYLNQDGILILEVGMSWRQLEQTYPNADFSWVDFEHGGEGVCVINADELAAWRDAGVI